MEGYDCCYWLYSAATTSGCIFLAGVAVSLRLHFSLAFEGPLVWDWACLLLLLLLLLPRLLLGLAAGENEA